MVPEEKRKKNGRVNGSLNNNFFERAAPEGKRNKNGSVNGGSIQNTGAGRKAEKNGRLDCRANERQHLYLHSPTSLWMHAKVIFSRFRTSNLRPRINGRKTEDKRKHPVR